MSGFTYPTISTVIPLYNELIDHIEDTIGDDDDDSDGDGDDSNNNDDDEESNNDDEWKKLKKAAKKSKTKLLEYYNKTNDAYLVSTILDPRLKLQYYKVHDWGDTLVNDTQNKLVYFNLL